MRVLIETSDRNADQRGFKMSETLRHILVVVEFPSSTNECATERHKIRVKARNSSQNRITGPYLRSELLQQVGLGAGSDGSSPTVDVYDNRRQEFISLLDPELDDEDLLTRLGRCVRCSVSVDKSRNQGDPLALMGRYFPYDATEGMTIDGKRLIVYETPNVPGAGTGLNIWDGAVLLAKYLEFHPEIVRSKRVLELGAGTGFVGIAAGLLGAMDVILSDLPHTLPLMQENIKRNKSDLDLSGCQRIECKTCDWFLPPPMKDLVSSTIVGRDMRQADVILVADCVWTEDLVTPLLETIRRYKEEAKSSLEVVISYQQRGKRVHDEFIRGIGRIFTPRSIRDVDLSEIRLRKPSFLSIFRCRV